MIERREEYMRLDSCFAELNSSPKVKMISAEELIASMDEQGITASVILNIGWKTQQLCIETNDYIMDSMSHYPNRLYGFCALQPADKGAVRELERCLQGGIFGIGELRPDTQGYDLGNPDLMSDIVEVIEHNNLCLLTHASEPVGHHYPGKGKTTPEMLYRFACNFPNVCFICAHWGGGLPFYALMPEVKTCLHNTYYDTAATPFLYQPQIFEHLVNIIGEDKILFGTDYPLMKQNRVISQIKQANISTKAKRLILSDNAKKILSI
jgi:uncharacterized protein